MKPVLASKWVLVGVMLSLALGISAVAKAADSLQNQITPERASMAQGVLAHAVVSNVTAPPANLSKMTLPAPAATASPTAAAPSTSTTATAQPPAESINAPVVGRVVWVKGDFKASLKNGIALANARALIQSSNIYLHDTLITGDNSQAQIVFTDNSLMTFRPDTKFYVNDYAYNPNSKDKSVGKYVMNLIQGGFRTITGLIAKANPSDYQVNTPVATIGVRGTDYTLILHDTGLYIGQTKGTPCIKAQARNLCLNSINRYATVANNTTQPVFVKQPPAFMMEPIPVTHITAQQVPELPKTIVPTTPSTTGPETPAAAPGSTPASSTTTTTGTQPTVGGSSNGASSNFCIQ